MQKQIKRKCQGCFELKNRDELIKITRLQNGNLKINPKSNELGRSVYICPKAQCIKNFIRKKRLKIALKYSNLEEISRIEQELISMSQ